MRDEAARALARAAEDDPSDFGAAMSALRAEVAAAEEDSEPEPLFARFVARFVPEVPATALLVGVAEACGASVSARSLPRGAREIEVDVERGGSSRTYAFKFPPGAKDAWPVDEVEAWEDDDLRVAHVVSPRHALDMVLAPESCLPGPDVAPWRARFLRRLEAGRISPEATAWGANLTTSFGSTYALDWTASDEPAGAMVRPSWWNWGRLRVPSRAGRCLSAACPGDLREAVLAHESAFLAGCVRDPVKFVRMALALFPADRALSVADFYQREAPTVWRCGVRATALEFEGKNVVPDVILRRREDGGYEAGVRDRNSGEGIRWCADTPRSLARELARHWHNQCAVEPDSPYSFR